LRGATNDLGWPNLSFYGLNHDSAVPADDMCVRHDIALGIPDEAGTGATLRVIAIVTRNAESTSSRRAATWTAEGDVCSNS
jgi:hypothetical protein